MQLFEVLIVFLYHIKCFKNPTKAKTTKQMRFSVVNSRIKPNYEA
jgi:hypothetical protein